LRLPGVSAGPFMAKDPYWFARKIMGRALIGIAKAFAG
jgi:hypothetical protein